MGTKLRDTSVVASLADTDIFYVVHDPAGTPSDGKTTLAALRTALGGSTHWLEPADVATTANVDLSTELEDGDTLNGITLATGQRVLVAFQTAPEQNGIYTVPASGAASRSTDANTSAKLISSVVRVRTGDVYAGATFYNMDAAITTLETDPVTFQTAEVVDTSTFGTISTSYTYYVHEITSDPPYDFQGFHLYDNTNSTEAFRCYFIGNSPNPNYYRFVVNGFVEATRGFQKRIIPLFDAATIAIDSDTTDIGYVTMEGNRTIGNPSGAPYHGQTLMLLLTQDGTGTRVPTWDTDYEFTAAFPEPVLSVAPNATDWLEFRWDADLTKWVIHNYSFARGLTNPLAADLDTNGFALTTVDKTGSEISGSRVMSTGNTEDGNSGDQTIATGTPSGTGVPGTIIMRTGPADFLRGFMESGTSKIALFGGSGTAKLVIGDPSGGAVTDNECRAWIVTFAAWMRDFGAFDV